DPTPRLPGFRDMEVHGNWHYRDLPFSAPGAPAPAPETPNALVILREFVDALDEPYPLAWFLHLAGDAHQPLHAVSRFLKPDDKGDRGGNDYALDHPARNLHAYWDNVVSRENDMTAIQKVASELLQEAPPASSVANLHFESWFRESFELAVSTVYKLNGPIIPEDYDKRAVRLGRERVTLAGYRLAAILNNRLQ
ncbi:MAG TPA: S1/P1 nuclease, partial [Bryobacteraceae bacterium]|nr:S1/P1 nuclease [Bryobacteraceae bacterium]